MREIRTSGSVRGGGGNVPTYSAVDAARRPELLGKAPGVVQVDQGPPKDQLAGLERLVEAFQEQAAEQAGQHADRQEEAGPASHPALAIGRQPTAGDDAVQVRVVLQGLAPGVQHCDKADLGAKVTGVRRDGAQGRGRAAEQDVVDDAFVQSAMHAASSFNVAYCTQQTGGLTRGMTLRAIPAALVTPHPAEPGWMAPFLASLAHDDLAPATLRGYRYDLRHFLAWHRTVQDRPFTIEGLAEYELIAYRQHMVAGGLRPATVNRRLDALRRLCRWGRGTGALSADAAGNVRPMRTIRNRQPAGLTDVEIHALLRAAGASSHGLAARNYALVQLMLQAGLRIGEVAVLRVADVNMNDRSGSVRIRQGKGLKARDVPLNATGRRALKQHLEQRGAPGKTAALFTGSRETAMPVRTIQAVVASVARRARLTRVPVSAHTLRHTFALGYLRDNPGKLLELASLLGHESLDTTAIYTRPSGDDLAADLERSHLNVDG